MKKVQVTLLVDVDELPRSWVERCKVVSQQISEGEYDIDDIRDASKMK